MGTSVRAVWRPAALLGIATALFACSEAPNGGDIVLITVDTLRADHLGSYGYQRPTSPAIDAFFTDGGIYERAYSATAYTSASTVSLLSGRLPQDHRVRMFDQLLPASTALVTDLLPDRYQTAAFVSNKVVSDIGMGMAHRFDHYDDDADMDESIFRVERKAEATTDAVLAWLSSDRDPQRPLFLWIHYMDPHHPYGAPEPWGHTFRHRERREPIERPIPIYAQKRGSSVTDPLYFVDRYDEEIRYTDAEIGRLLEGYAALAPVDRALVIFTADHGETLLERALSFTHASRVYEEVVRVPFLMRGPGVVRGRFDGLVGGIDVAPTLLAFAGADIPAALEGVDLRATPQTAADRTVFVESVFWRGAQWRAAIQGDRKWTVMLRGAHVGPRRRSFYDLETDAGELRPQAWRDGPGPGRRLLELVERDPDPAGLPVAPLRGGLRSQNLDYLKALGYVEE